MVQLAWFKGGLQELWRQVANLPESSAGWQPAATAAATQIDVPMKHAVEFATFGGGISDAPRWQWRFDV